MMNIDRPKVLCVHQSNELYGSDRVFAESVHSLRKRYPEARIDVMLPSIGPLNRLIEMDADNIFYNPIWVIRKSQFLSLRGILSSVQLFNSVWQARKLMLKYDLVYINTIVIINFLLAALVSKVIGGPPAIVHVHELITGIVGLIFGRFLRAACSVIICNSGATASAFNLSGLPMVHTVWNGTDIPKASLPIKSPHGCCLKILMPGRINSWKGQDLLIEAIASIKPKCGKISVRIVGDVYKGQNHFKERLNDAISKNGLIGIVELIGFCENMNEMYQWSDIVVVPSKSPEPFGVVAVEAMSHSRPVIAADHGGLQEIVVNNVTGWLFPPGDIATLASLVVRFSQDRTELEKASLQARLRAESKFTNHLYQKRIADICQSILICN